MIYVPGKSNAGEKKIGEPRRSSVPVIVIFRFRNLNA